MIKIKEFISDIVILVEDKSPEIKRHARFFFNELNKKSKNHIYNILPDIISRLCKTNISGDLDYDKFKKLMKYMFNFIVHNKQMENLVEKLLKRLDAAEEQNWGRITWCLAEIKWAKTYKIVKKLLDSELQKLYLDKLGKDSVWEPFEKIVQECSKVKMEQNDQNEFEEWKKRVTEFREKGADDEAAKKRAEEANKKPKRKRDMAQALQEAAKANSENSEEGEDKVNSENSEEGEEEEVEEEEEDVKEPPKKRQKLKRKPVARRSRKKRNVVVEEESESEEEEEEESEEEESSDNVVPKKKAKGRGRGRGRGRGKGRGRGRGRGGRKRKLMSEDEEEESKPKGKRRKRQPKKKKEESSSDEDDLLDSE